MGCGDSKEHDQVEKPKEEEKVYDKQFFKKNDDLNKMWSALSQPRKNGAPIIDRDRITKVGNSLFLLWILDMLENPQHVPVLKHLIDDKMPKEFHEETVKKIARKVEMKNVEAVNIVFETIDEDHNDLLDRKEFTNLYGIIAQLYKKHKGDGEAGGSADTEELATRLTIMVEKILDGNKDGIVTERELNTGITIILNNMNEVHNIGMDIASAVVQEIMNYLIDSAAKQQTDASPQGKVSWDGDVSVSFQNWIESCGGGGNFQELLCLPDGLESIFQAELTYKTIGEFFGIPREDVPALPKSNEHQAVLDLRHEHKLKESRFLALAVTAGKLLSMLTKLAMELRTLYQEQDADGSWKTTTQTITKRDFTAKCSEFFSGEGDSTLVEITEFFKQITTGTLDPENPSSPIKESFSTPGGEGDSDMSHVVEILQLVDAGKIINQMFTHMTAEKSKLIEELFCFFQFGSGGATINSAQLHVVFGIFVLGGAPVQDRPRLIFNAFDVDGNKTIDANKMKDAVKATADFYMHLTGIATNAAFKFMKDQVAPAFAQVILKFVPPVTAEQLNEANGAAAENDDDLQSPGSKCMMMADCLMAFTNMSKGIDGLNGGVGRICKPILEFKYKKHEADIKTFRKAFKKRLKDEFSTKYAKLAQVDELADNSFKLLSLTSILKEIEALC